MRLTRVLSLAVGGLFVLTSSAISIAGDWDWSSPSGSTDQGNYESRESLEAGSLPSGEHEMNSGDENVPTVESGGLKFREGIDTGP